MLVELNSSILQFQARFRPDSTCIRRLADSGICTTRGLQQDVFLLQRPRDRMYAGCYLQSPLGRVSRRLRSPQRRGMCSAAESVPCMFPREQLAVGNETSHLRRRLGLGLIYKPCKCVYCTIDQSVIAHVPNMWV